MDWNSPLGILRRGMSIERDGYNFYTAAAERASGERGKAMFLDLAAQEEDHLRLLLAEYRALEGGHGWLPYDEAMQQEFPLNPAERASRKFNTARSARGLGGGYHRRQSRAVHVHG